MKIKPLLAAVDVKRFVMNYSRLEAANMQMNVDECGTAAAANATTTFILLLDIVAAQDSSADENSFLASGTKTFISYLAAEQCELDTLYIA